ncbi:24340_t:CDS:1, partial [Gigaspora margarita]
QHPWVLYKRKKGTLVDSYTAEKKKFRQNPPLAVTNHIIDKILKTTKNMTPIEYHPWELYERKKEALVDLYANKKKAKSTISSNELYYR